MFDATHTVTRSAPSARPSGASFVMGGVAFRPPHGGWAAGYPNGEQRRWLAFPQQSPVLARVEAVGIRWAAPDALRLPRRPGGFAPPVDVEEAPGGVLRVRASGLRVRLLPGEGPGDWRLEGEVEASAEGVERLFAVCAAVLAEHHGGLALHTASVCWRERAVLFVGPSGAGKSTAVSRLPGARWLGHDRAVLWPSQGGGFLAFGLPWGGEAASVPPAARRWAPLGGIVRVARGERTRLLRLEASERAIALRAAAWKVVDGVEAELGRLRAVERVLEQVPVARLEHRLGEPFDVALARLLEEGLPTGGEVP